MFIVFYWIIIINIIIHRFIVRLAYYRMNIDAFQ